MPRRACLGCGRLIRNGSRCDGCRAAFEAGRDRRRTSSEPWRALYAQSDWKRARIARLRLDGHRCVDCRSGLGLSVDHEVPLRDLYRLAEDFSDFVLRACDLSKLRTRCKSCHEKADARRRRR